MTSLQADEPEQEPDVPFWMTISGLMRGDLKERCALYIEDGHPIPPPGRESKERH